MTWKFWARELTDDERLKQAEFEYHNLSTRAAIAKTMVALCKLRIAANQWQPSQKLVKD